MTTPRSIKSLNLDLPPSCVEFWPRNPEYAVVGTYHLDQSAVEAEESAEGDQVDESKQKSQARDGSLILLRVASHDIEIVHTHRTKSAIFDLHFGPPHLPPTHFVAATSTGSVEFYSMLDTDPPGANQDHVTIRYLKTIQLFPLDVLITSFVFHHTQQNLLMCTLNVGEVHVCYVGEAHPQATRRVMKHSLEAWCAEFSADGLSAFTGGDDSALKRQMLPSDLNQHLDAGNIGSLFDPAIDVLEGLPGWTDTRLHDAGVTAILPLIAHVSNHPGDLVVTGSYDDHIRLIQIPDLGRRTVLARLNLGGGVWRLKRLDIAGAEGLEPGATVRETILASCMHAGVRILNLIQSGEDWRFEVIAKFEEHQSMNYGTTVRTEPLAMSGPKTFVSTSFYDKLVCLWRF